MKTSRFAPATIDAYIATFPKNVQAILRKVRATIKRAAPRAEEAIKYQLPTFVLQGTLVHFGAFKEHIGFYALPSGHAKFQAELSKYRTGKGSVQFPLDQPIPFDLITKIVTFRVLENQARIAAKQKR